MFSVLLLLRVSCVSAQEGCAKNRHLCDLCTSEIHRLLCCPNLTDQSVCMATKPEDASMTDRLSLLKVLVEPQDQHKRGLSSETSTHVKSPTTILS